MIYQPRCAYRFLELSVIRLIWTDLELELEEFERWEKYDELL